MLFFLDFLHIFSVGCQLVYEFPMQDTFSLSLKNVFTHRLHPVGFETVGLLLVVELLGDVVEDVDVLL